MLILNKYVFHLFVYSIIFLSIFAFKIPKDDILYWTKNKRLSFSDFLGTPGKEDSVINHQQKLTHTFGTISKSIDLKYLTKQGKTIFTIYAGMNKKLSWIRNYDDSITLKHEQAHFDICEMYARKLRRDTKKVKSLIEAKDLYNKISEEENEEQDSFDKENTFISGGIT